MLYIHKHINMLPFTIPLLAFLVATSGRKASAEDAVAVSSFQEHFVEFHNGDVKLAGNLLLPDSESPVPAVAFVHGAGRQNREPYREVGEFFASQGIAALIYDKRGAGQSGGSYESHAPYENLVKDAMAAVALLKQHDAINQSQIGIWGLSQGAYIGAASASRTNDIKFVISAGASAADGMMTYYRDNLFRRYGLPQTLRDIAEKNYLIEQDLPWRNGFRLPSFAPRIYPPPNRYLHPAWSRVDQPVLAMWGQLDQHVPVGESVAGLKNSLAYADNDKWTVIILPKANHDLGISETGELHRKWRGYAPGALETMTEWAHRVLDHPPQVDRMKHEGIAPEAGVLSKLARYEKLRWYGNATVQLVLFVLFLISFLSNAVTGAGGCYRRLFHRQTNSTLKASGWVVNFKRAICAFNLFILCAFSVVVVAAIDQMRPNCPSILLYLPLLGTVSTIATVSLVIVLAKTRRAADWAAAGRLRGVLDTSALILFLPYLFYWNLIGFHF